jgi:site-specific DNA recombinase
MIVSHKILSEISNAYKAGKEPAFSYDRVSTQKQKKEGVSLLDQTDRAAIYAVDNNLHIVHTFSAVESAFKEGRKNFNDMLDKAIEFKVRHIIFKNTDRLGRNDIDWPRCKKLAREDKITIHLYELATIFEAKSTAETEMFLDNTSSMAKYWSNKISQGIKANHKHKIKEGTSPSRFSPLGYKYDKNKKRHIVDEATKNLVQYIFDLFDNEQYSIDQLREYLTNEGYKSQAGTYWSKSGIHNLLRNPFYAGEFQYGGQIYQGNHEPFITKDRYTERLKRMGFRYVGKKKKDTDYLFKNFLRSAESGRIFTGDTKTGAHKSGTYIYYVQPKPKYTAIKESKLFALIDAKIDEIKFSSEFAEFTKEVFRNAVDEQATLQSQNLQFITKKIVQIEKEQQRLLDLLIQGVDEKAVKSKMDDNRKVINRLENDRQKLRLNRQDFIFAVSDIIEQAREMPELYEKMTHEEKAELIREMADGITVHEGHLEINWKKPYFFILNPEVLAYKGIAVRTHTAYRARVDDFRTLIQDKICPEWQYWYVA